MQQPEGTVISEPSSKKKSTLSSDASSVMSSSTSVFVDSKELPQIRRSSVISVDSDHSDSIMHVNPLHSKYSGTMYLENESCDSPSNYSLTKPTFNLQKASTDLEDSDLFFSPKKSATALQNKSNTPTTTAVEYIEPDDFYIDDFDIDDFNDSDIPEYFDEPPTTSLLGRNSTAVTEAVKEGGSDKSSWKTKPRTPVPTPKPSKICSPGNWEMHVKISACIYQTSESRIFVLHELDKLQ